MGRCGADLTFLRPFSVSRAVIEQRTIETIKKFEPSSLTGVLWGYAKLAIRPSAALLGVLTAQITPTVADFVPQQLCNTIWALGTINAEDPALITVLAEALTVIEAQLNLSDVSNAVYGTFRLNFHHFHRLKLDFRGYIHVRGAAFSCLRLKWADMVLI